MRKNKNLKVTLIMPSQIDEDSGTIYRGLFTRNDGGLLSTNAITGAGFDRISDAVVDASSHGRILIAVLKFKV